MKNKLKYLVLLLMSLSILFSTTAAWANDMSCYLYTDEAYAFFDNHATAYLEIMYLSKQVNKNDTTKTYNPQQFARATASSVSGTKRPKSGYIFVNCTFRYYADYQYIGERYATV